MTSFNGMKLPAMELVLGSYAVGLVFESRSAPPGHRPRFEARVPDPLPQSPGIRSSNNMSPNATRRSKRTKDLDLNLNSSVDIIDTTGVWYSGKVCGLAREGRRVKVHYLSYSKTWDEWLDLPSARLATGGTRVRPEQQHIVKARRRSKSKKSSPSRSSSAKQQQSTISAPGSSRSPSNPSNPSKPQKTSSPSISRKRKLSMSKLSKSTVSESNTSKECKSELSTFPSESKLPNLIFSAPTLSTETESKSPMDSVISEVAPPTFEAKPSKQPLESNQSMLLSESKLSDQMSEPTPRKQSRVSISQKQAERDGVENISDRKSSSDSESSSDISDTEKALEVEEKEEMEKEIIKKEAETVIMTDALKNAPDYVPDHFVEYEQVADYRNFRRKSARLFDQNFGSGRPNYRTQWPTELSGRKRRGRKVIDKDAPAKAKKKKI
eukprot:7975_1